MIILIGLSCSFAPFIAFAQAESVGRQTSFLEQVVFWIGAAAVIKGGQ